MLAAAASGESNSRKAKEQSPFLFFFTFSLLTGPKRQKRVLSSPSTAYSGCAPSMLVMKTFLASSPCSRERQGVLDIDDYSQYLSTTLPHCPHKHTLLNPPHSLTPILIMHSREPKFDYFEYQQLRRDFCYNKPLSLRVSTEGRGSSFEVQELVEVKSGKCFLTDVAKLAHRFANHAIKATLAHNCIKLYYGHHLPTNSYNKNEKEKDQKKAQSAEEVKEQPLPQPTQAETIHDVADQGQTVIYSRLYADRKFQNASVQLGYSVRSNEFQLDSNLSAFLYERQNEYYLYGKALYKGKRWSAGAISIFDFSCRNLQTNNLVLELIPHPKHRFFVRAEVDGLRNYSLKYSSLKSYFDYLVLDYVCRPTNTLALMAEYRYDCNSGRTRTIESIIEKRFTRNTLKVGFNHLGDITMQLGLPLSSLGHNSRLDFGIQVADVLAARRISYGFSVHIHA